MKLPQIVLAAVVGIALAGGGFAAGMAAGRSATPQTTGAPALPSGAARFGAGGGPGFVRGQGDGQQLLSGRVISVNDGSVTVEVRQPGAQGASPTVSSQIVLIGTSTRVVKTSETDIKASDLKANDQIQIIGTADASGSLAASAIVVGGSALGGFFGGGGGGPGRGASPAPSPTR